MILRLVMAIYSTTDARQKFAEILKVAEEGEEVILTRRGEPIVTIAPFRKPGWIPKPGYMKTSLGWSAKTTADFDDSIPEEF